MFKKTAITLILLVLSILCIHNYQQSVYWKHQTAERNYNNWTTLYHMTTELKKTAITKDNIETYSLYINGIVQSVTTQNLMPAFNGTSVYSFLGTGYDALVQDLVRNDLEEDDLTKGFELFSEMNADLVTLCEFVLETVDDEDDRCQLVEPNSELYEEIEEKIQEFCDLYDKKIDEFYTK